MIPALLDGEPVAPPPFASLADALRDAPERFPGGEFQFFGITGDPVRQTFAHTLAAAMNIAAALHQRGVRPGDGLIVAVEDGGQFIATIWAGILIGATTVPLTSHMRRVKGADARARIIDGVRAKLVNALLVTDDPALSGAVRVADLTQEANVGVPDLAASARAAILTSGTSGAPKLAELGEAALLARWWPKLPEADTARAFLSWSPFDHIMGFSLCAPNLPRKVYLQAEVFAANPLRWLDVIEAVGISHATMTNFGLSLLVGALEKYPERRWALDKVVRIGVGAEDISADLCARFLDLLATSGLRSDVLILGYGLTECGPVVGGSTPFSALLQRRGALALDRPTPGHSVRIVAATDAVLVQGETGLIEVRGPTLFTRYVGDSAMTQEALTVDGWLRTGDLGRIADGQLTVTGRAKDIVLVNAKKYTCIEIEAEVKTRTGFEILAAPLTTDQTGRGKAVALFAVMDALPDDHAPPIASIRRAVADAFQFAPDAVALITREEVPRTSLGKVSRAELATRLELGAWTGRTDRLGGAAAQSAPDSVSRQIADIWSQLLKCPPPPADADFYESGGDSLLALQMSFALEKSFGIAFDIEEMPHPLTIAALADKLGRGAAAVPTDRDTLPASLRDRLQDRLTKFPGTAPRPGSLLRLVSGQGLSGLPVFWCLQYANEAVGYGRHVGAHRPAYVMRSGHLILDYATPAAAALARTYTDEIKAVWPGPYIVGGTCQGSILALAIARQLLAEGREVRLFAAADTIFPELFGATQLAAPTVLISARRSKFNPGRRFRYPEVGLRKWLPAGVMSATVESDYPRIMLGDSMPELAQALERAIDWAAGQPRCSEPAKPVPRGRYSAEFGFFGPEQIHEAGSKWLCPIALHNPGPWPWAPFATSGLTLCHRWLSSNGEILALPGGCEPLDGLVAPGDVVDAEMDVVVPTAPGIYRLEIDLVEEGVCWFSERYAAPLQIPVTVCEARGLFDRFLSRLRHPPFPARANKKAPKQRVSPFPRAARPASRSGRGCTRCNREWR